MIRLGVNIDHVATLRQLRGTPYPDPLVAAVLAEKAGADNITLHLREDRRHIQDKDVELLKGLIHIPMNLEMAVTDEMLMIAQRIKPEHCCLVPEKRREITTESGLDVVGEFEAVYAAVQTLQAAGMRVSLFIDPIPQQIEAAYKTGASTIEIHTGPYAEAVDEQTENQHLDLIQKAAHQADQLGLEVHAGHGLNTADVEKIAAIPSITTLNIGHFIVARAVFIGFEAAVREIKALMIMGRGEARLARG